MEAHITDGGRIYEGHEVTDVVHEQAVEEVNVLILKTRQVQVLVNVGLARLDHLHGAQGLGLERLHGMGQETSEVLGDTLLGSEGKACHDALVLAGCRVESSVPELTLVPERLADDLVASGVALVDILGRMVLLDLTIVVLGVTPVLIQRCHLHCGVYGGEID